MLPQNWREIFAAIKDIKPRQPALNEREGLEREIILNF